MVEPDDSWFIFRITETGGEGVEVPKLARLLEHLSASFYAIARSKIGTDPSRPGPRTAAEDALAAVRLVRISPGSTIIEFAPPEEAIQTAIPEPDMFTADALMSEFFDEVRRIEAGEAGPPERRDVRRRVQEVVEDAGEIGARGELQYRPLLALGNVPAVNTLTFRTRAIPASEHPSRTELRSRRLVGHAYMVDVEPGRQRLRLKMPDDRDATLDVDEGLLVEIPEALDRVVELEVAEQLEDGAVTGRTVSGLAVLPSSAPGSDEPPKTVVELAKEQGIPPERPDYVSIASSVWEDEDEIASFDQYIASMRKVETG